MHELSIACSIIETVEENLPSPETKVSKVFLKIGKLSGVVKDALLFSFEIAAQNSRLIGAKLEIEELAVVVYCAKCDEKTELGNPPVFRCQNCGELTGNVVQGKELEIISVEIENGKSANS